MRVSPGVGPAWRGLAGEAEQELRTLGSHGELRAGISAEGLLSLRLVPPDPSASEVLKKYRALAQSTCEQCGAPARAYSGAMVTIACPACRPA